MKRCVSCFRDIPEELEICPYCGYIEGSSVKATNYLEMGAILASRYIIGSVIGNDKFGVTYIAWDGKLEQRVAIKEYLPNEFSTREPGQTKITVFGGDENAYFRDGMNAFLDEAKRLAKFQNEDGIVKVFNYISENDTAYIVMEYLEGQTLRNLLETKKVIPEREATQMLLPIMESLKTVHADGMIHGNITPDSIFVTSDGKAKLIDFGASRFASTHSRNLTEMLNPGYSPEEQYKNREDMGAYSDVYSLAATLYKMVTGETPPDALERKTNIESTNRDIIKEPSLLGKHISLRWENAVMNALNVRIEDRTQNLGQLIWELNSVLPALRRYGNTKKININRWPLWIKIVSGVSILLIVAVVVLLATGVFGKTMDFITGSLFGVGYTNVPNIVNMHVDEASTECANSSVILQVYDKSYSSDIKSGLIKSQSVEEGCVVEKNSVVFAAVSAGQAMILVQDYQGYNGDAVAEGLDESGLKYSLVTEQSGIMPGCVVAQSVDYGTICDAETFEIELTISEGQNYEEGYSEVPDFSNVPFESAADIATDNSMYVVKTTTEASDTVPEGCVISQIPEAGTIIKNGGTVELVVSGEEKQLVPDVQYKDADEAISYLQSLGFVVETKYEDNDVVYKNHVVSQSLVANTIAEPGEEIVLFVSNGNPQVEIIEYDLDKLSVETANISATNSVKMNEIQSASIGGYEVYEPPVLSYSEENGLKFTTNLDEVTTPYLVVDGYDEILFYPEDYTMKVDSISASEPDEDGYVTITIVQSYFSYLYYYYPSLDLETFDHAESLRFFDYYTGSLLFDTNIFEGFESGDGYNPVETAVINLGDSTYSIYTSWFPAFEYNPDDYLPDKIVYTIQIPQEYDGLCIATNRTVPTYCHSALYLDSQVIPILDQSIWQEDMSTVDLICVRISDYVAENGKDDAVVQEPEPIQETEAIQETEPEVQITEQVLTEDDVYLGIMNYLTDDYGIDWNTAPEVSWGIWSPELADGSYCTSFRSYTGAWLYYYTDATTGYTYETEFVPGIVEEETPTGVSFYIQDYIY